MKQHASGFLVGYSWPLWPVSSPLDIWSLGYCGPWRLKRDSRRSLCDIWLWSRRVSVRFSVAWLAGLAPSMTVAWSSEFFLIELQLQWKRKQSEFRLMESEFLGRFEPEKTENSVENTVFEPEKRFVTPSFPAEFPIFLFSTVHPISFSCGSRIA